MNVLRCSDAMSAAQACAARIVELLGAVHGPATLAISGGSSPKIMFEIFARTMFPWERVHLFWVDERIVPPEDPQSNFKLANDAWLKPVGFPEANIHRIQAELGAHQAAHDYVEQIRAHFHLRDTELPRFDVIHRGMGPDGHTASLFPGDPHLDDHTGIAAAVWVEKMQQWRVTLLPGVLEAARHTVMLVTGADKAPVLGTVLSGGPPEYPAQDYPAKIAAQQADWYVA
jgi:6-phosphogluconolactonase